MTTDDSIKIMHIAAAGLEYCINMRHHSFKKQAKNKKSLQIALKIFEVTDVSASQAS